MIRRLACYLSLRWKFMLSFIAIAVIVLVLALVMFRGLFAKMESQASDNASQEISFIGNKVDSLLLTVDNSILPLVYDKDVASFCHDNEDPQLQSIVEAAVSKASASHKSIGLEILLLNKSMKIIAASRPDLLQQYRVLGSQWINKIHSSAGQKVVISGYTVSRPIETIVKVICIARLITDKDGSPIGYAIAEIPTDQIRSICQEIPLGNGGYVAVLDNDGFVIYSTNTDLIGSQQKLAPSREESLAPYYHRTIDGSSALVIDYLGSEDGLQVIGFVPFINIYAPVKELRSQYLWMLGVVCLVVLIIAYAISFSISHPVIQMKNYMHEVQSGNLSIQINSRRKDEIGQLQSGFDEMIRQLKVTIDQLYESRFKENDARYQLLLSAINPHFLYNTLESISMTAYLNNDIKCVEMLQNLAEFLRYSANPDARDISVSQEMEHINSFIYLHLMRHPGLFQIIWNVDDSLLQYRMLNFLLLPIVENSIIHGFKDINEGGLIEINAFGLGSDVLIQVRDNGCGISSDRLQELNEVLYAHKSINQVMALKNVHERIGLAYGEDYGIEVRNCVPRGCIVEVRLPRAGLGKYNEDTDNR